jgi:uncharacterized protein (TIGR00299 family) protein
MRVAYGDLIGGVSGDMFVAALLDLGVPLKTLRSELRKIRALEFDLETGRKIVHAVRAARFRVTCAKAQPARPWKEIRKLIQSSTLHAAVKTTGIEVFTRLAEAEAKIHGIAVEKVHFHELGATDSIVDILAAAVGIHELGIDALHFSPVPLGRGMTRSRHGPLPLPGPATLELLKNLPTFGVDVDGETVTPTGAALVRALGQSYGAQPAMSIEAVGYGAGQKQFPTRPNLFRLLLGRAAPASTEEEMVLLETNIDDMNPQLYDHVMERLFSAGARDVFLSAIQMKKNRPATLLSVICEPDKRQKLGEIILQETTTIGVRYHAVNRIILPRQTKKIHTRYGEVTVKIVEQPDGRTRATPEYDDLRRIAAARKLPIKRIHDEVMRAVGR